MPRNPRVLQVVLSLNPGGTERLVVELVKRLNRDVPMAVCCIDAKGSWSAELEAEGVVVEELKRPSGFTPALGRHIAAMARRHDADILHAHHYSPFVYASLARVWAPRCRVVFTEHGRLSDAKPSRKRIVANAILAKVPHAVFAVSGDLRDHIVAEGFPAGLVEVIYNGIDPATVPDAEARAAIRQRLKVSAETLVLVTIARLDPVKDIANLLVALRLVNRRRPAFLLIVGDGPLRGSLESMVKELGLNASVAFLGSRNDARDWLAGCDVYVNSSTSEGVSLTILEAMAAARPVVATNVGGTPEVINDECGRLVPARDPEKLACAIEALAEDGPLRERLGAFARRRVLSTFSLDRMVQAYHDVYARVS